MKYLALFALILTASLVLAVTSGSSSSSSSGSSSGSGAVQLTPEIFVTGECSANIVFLGASSNGSAIKNAQFTFIHFSKTRSPRPLSIKLITDSNGVAKFNPEGPGLYQMKFSHSEYQTTTTTFNLGDCPAIKPPDITPPPFENTTADELREANLSCSDFSTMRERVNCRITLPGDVALLRYLPEECRELNGSARGLCIKDYKWQQGCRHLEKDPAREKCYRDQINLTSDIRGEKLACGDNSSCVSNLRERVFGYVKFRIYNIEEKAEELLERGLLTEDKAVDFITFLEAQKIEFNKDDSVQSKKSVIRTVQSEWKKIREGVVKLLRSRSRQ